MMLKEKLMKFNWLGIRILTDDEYYNVGDICRHSYEWDYENDCSTYNTDNPIKLNGTCAIDITFDNLYEMPEEEIINKINQLICDYAGDQKVLIGGYSAEYGSDENEIIIEDAEVLYIVSI